MLVEDARHSPVEAECLSAMECYPAGVFAQHLPATRECYPGWLKGGVAQVDLLLLYDSKEFFVCQSSFVIC